MRNQINDPATWVLKTTPAQWRELEEFLHRMERPKEPMTREFLRQVVEPYQQFWAATWPLPDVATIRRLALGGNAPGKDALAVAEKNASAAFTRWAAVKYGVSEWCQNSAIRIAGQRARVPQFREWGSQRAFLQALSDVNPEMLRKFRSTVVEPHPEAWRIFGEMHSSVKEDRSLAASNHALTAALIAFDSWNVQHHVVDDWFVEAVAWTAYSMTGGSREEGWYSSYAPAAEIPTSTFGPWFPGWKLSKTAHRKEALKKCAADLNAFYDRQERASGLGKDNLDGHALWTAQRFVGMQYREIVDRWTKGHRLVDPEETIRRSVRRFAGRIKLTLPPTRYAGGGQRGVRNE